MDAELTEVREFLAAHEPFAQLPAAVLDELPRRLQVRYVRRGTQVLSAGRPNDLVHIVRSGAFDIVDESGALVERTEPGGSFGSSSVLSRSGSLYTITAIEDSLVLVMGADVFTHLVDHHSAVRNHYDQQRQRRMREAVVVKQSADDRSAPWLRLSVGELGRREPVTAPSTATIREAATQMSRHRVSALPVLEDGRLVGILTDRDLRTKVVATGLGVDAPVAEVMTPSPVQVAPEAKAFEALLLMTGRRVHHLPVVQDGRLVAMVSSGDIMRLQQADPVFLVGDIERQDDLDGLAAVARRVPALVEQMLRQDASADDISHLLSSVADGFTRRLVTMALEDLGPAPRAWCWMALGSQARRELGIGSDQDHALVIADAPDQSPLAPREAEWFASLARHVTDGLEACGYRRCDGEVMASNPQWRLSVSQWRRQFGSWINEPTPQAVLHSQIFFDARCVHGSQELLDQVRRDVLSLTPRAQRFLGQMAAMAVERQPPLGFFRGLVLARRGEHAESFDLKANGVHAVIELARVHALAHGVEAVGTTERLQAVARITGSEALGDLVDAFQFIAHVRLAHQSAQARAGEPVDNVVNARELSSFDRRHLKDAFAMVRSAQESLAYGYQTHLMG